jgi:hypothetical protein
VLGEGLGALVGKGLGEIERPARLGFPCGVGTTLLGDAVCVPTESIAGAIVGTGFGLFERAAKVGFACGSAVGSPISDGASHLQLH